LHDVFIYLFFPPPVAGRRVYCGALSATPRSTTNSPPTIPNNLALVHANINSCVWIAWQQHSAFDILLCFLTAFENLRFILVLYGRHKHLIRWAQCILHYIFMYNICPYYDVRHNNIIYNLCNVNYKMKTIVKNVHLYVHVSLFNYNFDN
jgi:hypothetical protein